MSERFYHTSADVVTSIHFVWTSFMIVGAILTFFLPWYAWIQIGTLSFTLLINLPFGGHCPLTVIEEKLRRRADKAYVAKNSWMVIQIKKFFGTEIKVRSIRIVTAILYMLSYATSIWVLVRGG